jgi:hypothetical protein
MPVEVRRTTHEDMVEFIGEHRYTVSAWTGVLDGKIIAIGGLAFVDGYVVAFFDLDDEARKYPVTFHRMARRALREALPRHRFIFSENGRTETSRRWLKRLGFVPYDEEETVLICQN